MAESAGIYTVTANNLANGASYDFKIVSDNGSPPAQWGAPEITPDTRVATILHTSPVTGMGVDVAAIERLQRREPS